MKNIVAVAICLAALFSGCTNLPGIATALSKDPAFVTVQVRTIYGTAFLTRDGRPGNGNTVTPEGAVTSTPPTNVINRLEMSPQLAQMVQQQRATPPQAQARVITNAPPIKFSTNSPPAT